MQKRKIMLGALAAIPMMMMAKGNITGTVINKETGEPMDFVTVQLVGANGKPLPVGVNTDENGKFVIPNVADGKYTVKITNVGSVAQERPVTVAGQDAAVGTVRLADDTKLLQEVVVEGVRSQMRFELDKKIFQVDANIAAAGASASELLESIPSVEVDQDGQVSLRGNSSVTVWINGKESGLSADNRAQILEQIPAETIERVEVITNPSAKYSPEGTSGIINIILKKDRRAGYFGSAEFGANTRGGGNTGVNINVNRGKWEGYTSVGFRMRRNEGSSLSDRTYFGADGLLDTSDDLFLNSRGTSNNMGNNLFVRAGVTYNVTDQDALYVNGFGMFGHRKNWGTTSYWSNLPNHWTTNSNFTDTKSDNRGAHGELGYTHKWTDNHTLDILGSYNYWGGPSTNFYHQNQVTPGLEADDIYDLYQEQQQQLNVNSIETKVDYVNQFSKNMKFEAGYQGTYSYEKTPISTVQGQTQENMVNVPALYNNFVYNNNISALYTTFGGKAGKFSYSAGLRGEYWKVNTKSLGWDNATGAPQTMADQAWYSPKGKFQLFPSAFASYSLPYDNELQINYTRRIRRPWGGELNSFQDISDPTNIRYGNPQLEPEYSNAFELNYIKSWTMHMISVSAYARTSENVMDRIAYLRDNVMYSTSMNVTDRFNAGTEIVVKNSLFHQVLDLTTTVNLYNNHISAWERDIPMLNGGTTRLSGKARDSFAWDARMMAGVKLPWKLSMQATGRYSSKMLSAQGSTQPGWSVDLSMRKNVGDWSFSVSCRDIFNTRKFKNTVDGIDYTQFNERQRGKQNIQFSVKYSFGNMRAKKNKNNQGGEPMDGSGYGDMGE